MYRIFSSEVVGKNKLERGKRAENLRKKVMILSWTLSWRPGDWQRSRKFYWASLWYSISPSLSRQVAELKEVFMLFDRQRGRRGFFRTNNVLDLKGKNMAFVFFKKITWVPRRPLSEGTRTECCPSRSSSWLWSQWASDLQVRISILSQTFR